MAIDKVNVPEGFTLEQELPGINVPEGFTLESEIKAPEFSREYVDNAYANYIVGMIPHAGPDVKVFSRKKFEEFPGLVQSYHKQEPGTWPEVLAKGYERGGVGMVKGIAGGALSVAEYIESLPPSKDKDILGKINNAMDAWLEPRAEAMKNWSNEMLAGIKLYYEENPGEAARLSPDSGVYQTLKQYVTDPKMLVQGLLESAPLMLEAGLGTAVAGPIGGIVAMGGPITGEVYADAREAGTKPGPAFAQAVLTGAIEAGIEQWTFGRKLGLARNFKKILGQGMNKIIWEGGKAFFRGAAEEGSQQFNRNFWNWVFTDRSQVLSEGIAQAVGPGGLMELIMAGGFAGTGYLTSGKQISNEEKIFRINKIRDVVNRDEKLTPKQKTEINTELDKVVPEDISNEYWSGPAYRSETGFVVKEVEIKPEAPAAEAVTAKIDRLQAEIDEFVNKGQKPPSELIAEINVAKKELRQKPIEIAGVRTEAKPAPTKPTTRKATAADVVRFEQDELDNRLGVSAETIQELEKHSASDVVWVTKLKEDAARYGVEAGMEEAITPKQIEELVDDISAQVEGGKIIATDGEGGYLVLKPTKKQIAKRQRQTRDVALKLGHFYPKILEWDEKTRRQFNFDLTGKLSMKDMTQDERVAIVELMREEIFNQGLSGSINPDDLTGLNITVGGEQISAIDMLNEAEDVVNQIKSKERSTPLIRKERFPGKDIFRDVESMTIGVDNDVVSTLVDRISGGKQNIISRVLNKYRLQSILTKDEHFRVAVELLRQGMKDAGITTVDLGGFSRSNNPRFELLKTISDVVGKSKTRFYDIDINGKKYHLSMGNLMQFYLLAQQEAGMRHLTKSGLRIFKNATGPLSEEKIAGLINMVESNPKAFAIVKLITEISMNHNANNLNAISNRVEHKDLATEKNWWHLEVYHPELMKGRATYSVSLLENKNIFRSRIQTGEGALVLRDVFDVWGPTQTTISEYIGMAEWLRAANMMLNHRPFIDAVLQKGLKKVRSNLIEVLHRAQGAPAPKTRAGEVITRILRPMYRGVLNLNLKVVGAQYTSTMLYAAIIDKKYIKYLGHGSSPTLIKEMFNHNAFAWDRFYMGHQSIEMAELGQLDQTLRIFTGKTMDVNKAGMFMHFTDIMAIADGWKVAKAMITDEMKSGPLLNDEQFNTLKEKPVLTSEEEAAMDQTTQYWNRVNETAMNLWNRTQPSWDKWNRSFNTSDPGAMRKVLFLFRSYYEKALSLCHSANATFQNSEKTAADVKNLAKTYGTVFGNLAATSLMRMAIGCLVFRQRKTIWDIIGEIISSPLRLMAIFGGFLSRTVSNFIKILAEEKPQQNYNPMSSLVFESVNNTLIGTEHFAKSTAHYLSGDEDKGKQQMMSGLKSTWKGVGLWMGLPVYEINRYEKIIFGEEDKEKQQIGRLGRLERR